jgi:polyferredoxin
LESLQKPAVDFKNFWPLQYYCYFDWNISSLIDSGRFGIFVLIWGTFGFLVLTPILTYFYGKRWYCSWVCGCGGLAETAGDHLRSLSDKSKHAWKWERAVIYSILALILIITLLILLSRIIPALSGISQSMAHYYGLFIGAIFSGIIGVGFYPLLGARIWCRFGCPMAAYLGLWQKYFSRFRITTNHGQCISCGNCSTHCEMGIDVKSYAQKGEDIKRASCVGCGICSAVCPRGVLRLENK